MFVVFTFDPIYYKNLKKIQQNLKVTKIKFALYHFILRIVLLKNSASIKMKFLNFCYKESFCRLGSRRRQ